MPNETRATRYHRSRLQAGAAAFLVSLFVLVACGPVGAGPALAGALAAVLAGASDSVLDEYNATRRPIAHQVVEMTDRLTRLATLPRAARPIRNTAIGLIGRVPSVQRALAMRLSGLVYR